MCDVNYNEDYKNETFTPDVDYTEVEAEETGMTGLVKGLICAGGAAVIGGLAWAGKKLYDWNKERKALRKPDPKAEPEEEEAATEEDFVEETNEE